MIGLIVLIVACVMINEKAKELEVKATPYILGSILLAFIPSLILSMIPGRSFGIVILSLIISTALCFIPYYMLIKDNSNPNHSDSNKK